MKRNALNPPDIRTPKNDAGWLHGSSALSMFRAVSRKKKKGRKVSALGFLCSKPQANVVFLNLFVLEKYRFSTRGMHYA